VNGYALFDFCDSLKQEHRHEFISLSSTIFFNVGAEEFRVGEIVQTRGFHSFPPLQRNSRPLRINSNSSQSDFDINSDLRNDRLGIFCRLKNFPTCRPRLDIRYIFFRTIEIDIGDIDSVSAITACPASCQAICLSRTALRMYAMIRSSYFACLPTGQSPPKEKGARSEDPRPID
jgi:hypothetical protein